MQHVQITLKSLTGFTLLGASLLLACAAVFGAEKSLAGNDLQLNVLDEEFSLQQFPAQGSQLVLYIAPGYGFNGRGMATAQALADQGVEVWMVDLAENLFLPLGNDTIRSFDGRHVARIIEQAHKLTGKNISLLSSSFGAIPLLRGARQWQLNNANLKHAYLNGAILFSPELYKAIPPLGVEPEFEPITSASNIPIMIYQSELRNNRWQLANVIQRLEQGHAVVYRKILPGIVAFFYEIDESPKTRQTLRELPQEIPRIITLLESTPTPLKAVAMESDNTVESKGLDTKLKPYQGKGAPLPFELEDINGERIVRKDFKNKITVVNFWATWCPPCVEEIPMLNRLRAKMAGAEFELISINFGEEKGTIESFLKKVNVEFPVLLDTKGRTAGDWNTVVLPSTYVIGPDGEFAYAVNAAIEWDSPEVVAALRGLLVP